MAPGREHLDRTWPEFQAEIAAAFGDLPAEQQVQLLALTPTLTDALRQRIATRVEGAGPNDD